MYSFNSDKLFIPALRISLCIYSANASIACLCISSGSGQYSGKSFSNSICPSISVSSSSSVSSASASCLDSFSSASRCSSRMRCLYSLIFLTVMISSGYQLYISSCSSSSSPAISTATEKLIFCFSNSFLSSGIKLLLMLIAFAICVGFFPRIFAAMSLSLPDSRS